MNKQFLARQGDLLIQGINKLPEDLKKKENNILVHSDSTLHDHSLKQGIVYLDKENNIFIDAFVNTLIVHTQDHNPIDLPKGLYKIIRQREYTMQDATRIVQD